MSYGLLHVGHQCLRLDLLCLFQLSVLSVCVIQLYTRLSLSPFPRDSEYVQYSDFFSPFLSRVVAYLLHQARYSRVIMPR